VPLNLATSIFGMNLQQLNGSGKSLQAFIGTSFVALVITGGTWFFIEQLNGYRYWHSKRYERAQTVKSKFSVGERIAMIAWLFGNNELSWMWKSGAWWRIPINNGTTYIQDPDFRGAYLLLSATDYVSKYSQFEIRDRVVGQRAGVTNCFDERYIRSRGAFKSEID
jgi:hypothetical protein